MRVGVTLWRRLSLPGHKPRISPVCYIYLMLYPWYGSMVTLICFDITPPHYHHHIDTSESIELQLHSVECLLKIKLILSTIFHAIYGILFIQLTNFSYDDCENMCTYLIFIIKSEVCTICHCLGLGNETMAYSVFLYSCTYFFRYILNFSDVIKLFYV